MRICTEDLTHIYMPDSPFAVSAIEGITVNIEAGSFAAVIGPSGSGKSTLIQHLNGLLKPTAGRVVIDGQVVGENKVELIALRRRIGLVFQMPEQQFFAESVFDEVAFAPRNLGFKPKQVDELVYQALDLVSLDWKTFARRSPFQLSSGQKRLAAIAAILVQQPEALILDEPAAGLDPEGRRNLYLLLSRLNQEKGLTIVVVTHRLDDLCALADHYLLLSGGRLVMHGPPEELFSQDQKLRRLGLDLPPVTRFMHLLAEKGAPVKRTVYTMEQACREINCWLKKETGS
ncbi:MAG: energy-coupling factor transporter ATPase [Dethiobacter sp.]|jgi:energy-coupling factor transport system ATP-binding protein|nr:energy-coupling factor transporter ATPase [Dethiobacter sp.]